MQNLKLYNWYTVIQPDLNKVEKTLKNSDVKRFEWCIVTWPISNQSFYNCTTAELLNIGVQIQNKIWKSERNSIQKSHCVAVAAAQ